MVRRDQPPRRRAAGRALRLRRRRIRRRSRKVPGSRAAPSATAIDVGPIDTDGILDLNNRDLRLALRLDPRLDARPHNHGPFQPLPLRDSYPKRRRSLPAARPEPVAGDRLTSRLESLPMVAPRALAGGVPVPRRLALPMDKLLFQGDRISADGGPGFGVQAPSTMTHRVAQTPLLSPPIT